MKKNMNFQTCFLFFLSCGHPLNMLVAVTDYGDNVGFSEGAMRFACWVGLRGAFASNTF